MIVLFIVLLVLTTPVVYAAARLTLMSDWGAGLALLATCAWVYTLTKLFQLFVN